MLDDAALLIRFSKDRSNEAFSELVSRYLNFVYSHALRQVAGDTHLAEDVALSVFADLARKPKEISNCPVLARWLYTSTHHAAAKAVRSEQRRKARETIAQAMNGITNDSANDAEWAQIRPWLDEALRSLSQQDSDAILLRFFDSRSFAEIGVKLGLNENAARMRVERALEKLRNILSRQGITSTTVAIAALLSNEALVAAPSGLVAAITDAAMASTVGGGTTTITLFHYMSTKLGISAAAIIVAVAIGFSGYEYRIAHVRYASALDERLQYNAELRELKELRERNDVAQKNRLNFAQRIADLRAKRAAGIATANVQAASQNSSPATQNNPVKPTAASDPKLRSDLEAWFKGLVSIQFGPFLKNAGLSMEQQARLLDLLTLQKTLALGSVVTSLRPDAVSSDQITQQIQDLLATTNAGQQYQDYLRTEDLRPVTAILAANLAYTSTPLTADQGEQLTQILADNSPTGLPMNPQTVNWDAALNEAQNVLSAPQLAVLKNEAVLVSSEGIPGTSFHPAGSFGGAGEVAPVYVYNQPAPGK